MPLIAADPLVTVSPSTPIGHHTIIKANKGLKQERGQLSVLTEVNERCGGNSLAGTYETSGVEETHIGLRKQEKTQQQRGVR